jgi:hypothetical protein
VFTVKQGLFAFVFLSIVWLNFSLASADFQLLSVTTSRESAIVPVGDVLVKVGNEAGNSVNTDGAIGTKGIHLPTNSSLTVIAQPKVIFLTVAKGSTTQGQDLTINSTFTPQTIVKSYTRDNVATNLVDNFTLNKATSVSVEFGLAMNSAAREYQFFFGAPGVPDWNASNPSQMLGMGYTVTNPQASFSIPSSVFSHLQAGNNLYVPVRVIDFEFRYHDSSFEFDLQPMGGGAAVPEPSTWWMIGLLASSYAGRQGWKRWRKRK